MSIKETLVHIRPDLTSTQVEQFEQDMISLKNEWNQADINTINSEDFKKKINDQFDHLLVQLGYGAYDPDDAERLIHQLYLMSGYKGLMEYIVIAYRQFGDDSTLSYTYELMLDEMRSSFDEE